MSVITDFIDSTEKWFCQHTGILPIFALLSYWRMLLFCNFISSLNYECKLLDYMILAPGLDVVDNLEQLALKTSGPIKIYELKGSNINNAISPYREHRNILMERIQVLPLEHATDPVVLDQVLQNVSSGKQFYLAPKLTLEMYQNILFNGKY